MDFKAKFTTYTHTELLRIVNNPGRYQPEAVETAKALLAERQLTDEEIRIAEDALEAEKRESDEKERRQKAVEDTFRSLGHSLLEKLNPIQEGSPTTDKTIRLISLLFGGFFLLQLFREFGMIRYILTDDSMQWDLSMVLYVAPLVTVPIATILFYKRHKLGWLLLALFLTCSTVSALVNLMLAFTREPSGIAALDSLFPRPSPFASLLTCLFFAGNLWAIGRETVRGVYGIARQTLILTIALSAVLSLLIFRPFF
ncbi:MAG TPA: hypothetical protein VK183_14060 [Flavobacterium sp.]|nr:hypothetical protein [Flavobacterium sp.]